jgi:hypothetical protein
MKRFWTATALGFLLFGFFAAAPAQSDDLDRKIKALEVELSQLKSEQAEVKAQQIEMKKEATAAAAALPNFTYRPGSGMMIEAVDKSWSFRASMRADLRVVFESGLSEFARETSSVFARRFRPDFYYCINDCLYELQMQLDLDGFGTGNGKNATNTATGSILHHGLLFVHLEKLNPWLPTFLIGMDGNSSISAYRQGSDLNGSQLEYDLLSRNTFDDGTWGNGFGLNWDNRSLSDIGIPGRLVRFNVAYATTREADDGLQSFREQRSVTTYINVEPFSETKNKWIQGLGVDFGAWLCPNESNHTAQNPQSIACNRLRIQDVVSAGRQNLFDTGVAANSGAIRGSGLTHLLMPGLGWTIGPYRLRVVGGFQRFDGQNPNWKGNEFLIGHDLFLWSPKGFLTGNSNTPGSVLLGTHFERTDVSCPSALQCNNGGQFNRSQILLREWDLWYFLAPSMSVGLNWLWYDASNVLVADTGTGASGIQGSNNVSRNLGCKSSHQHTLEASGRGCDWLDFFIGWRYQF